MGAPKPTLGYASRTDSILGMQAQGVPNEEICRRIGIKMSTLTALEHSAARSTTRQAGRKRRPAEAQGRTVLFPVDVLEQLVPHAAARKISPNELARRLVEAAVEDRLVDAVLDDGELV